MTARFKELVLDALDHHAQADWWCRALGYTRRGDARPPGDPIPIVDPAGHGPLIWLHPVPEPKTGKNRLHFDVIGEVAELTELGAKLLREPGGDIAWAVMADPEGNEFCVFAPG